MNQTERNEWLKFAEARIRKAQQYGADMETSQVACIEDVIELLKKCVEEK